MTFKVGALSSTNLPVKSLETPKANERHHIDIVIDINNKQETKDVFKNVKELCDRTLKLKSLENWKFDCTEDYLRLKYILSPYLVPKYEFVFCKDLSFVIVIFGCNIPATHDIYRQNGNTVRKFQCQIY